MSEAKIECNNESSRQFNIVTGVKQGGILSPFLFNIFIDELLENVLKMKIGAKIDNIDLNIKSYCDDLNLLFSHPVHGQMMINKCSEFADKWRIKFNPKKSNVTVFGNPVFINAKFKLKNDTIENTNKVKILGYEFMKSMNENEYLIENFSKVRKSFFALNKFGMKPNGLNPFLQAFIFNTFCLSKFTYGIEIMNLNTKTINCLNVMQNNLLRYLFQLSKHNYLSSIQQALKIFSFKHLYYKYKLGFRSQIESYSLSKEVLDMIIIRHNRKEIFKKSASFISSLDELTKLLTIDISDLGKKDKLNNQMIQLNEKFNKKPEMVKIVKFCLENYGLKEHKDNLKVITYFENQKNVMNMNTIQFS
jgi:hypothetical protein